MMIFTMNEWIGIIIASLCVGAVAAWVLLGGDE